MPSEKMKYILRRAAKSAMRTDIPMSPLKEEIESIFNPNNIDDDCDTIDTLLRPYQLKLDSLMSAGKYHEAFQCFYEILDGCMAKIAKMEAYEDYGSPFCVSDWERYKGN